jgi:hypothetical protein
VKGPTVRTTNSEGAPSDSEGAPASSSISSGETHASENKRSQVEFQEIEFEEIEFKAFRRLIAFVQQSLSFIQQQELRIEIQDQAFIRKEVEFGSQVRTEGATGSRNGNASPAKR